MWSRFRYTTQPKSLPALKWSTAERAKILGIFVVETSKIRRRVARTHSAKISRIPRRRHRHPRQHLREDRRENVGVSFSLAVGTGITSGNRTSDVSARILARMSVSVSALWNAGLHGGYGPLARSLTSLLISTLASLDTRATSARHSSCRRRISAAFWRSPSRALRSASSARRRAAAASATFCSRRARSQARLSCGSSARTCCDADERHRSSSSRSRCSSRS